MDSDNNNNSSNNNNESDGSLSPSSYELYGWLAAMGGMLAFGSFGVPVKSKVVQNLDIDPLVMQSYKTAMCFLTSCVFVMIRGEPIHFTPWGIVSGLFWVPGGVATIYAIQKAGLAIAIGVGSSCIVLVSFTWGIFGFHEHVHDRIEACAAVACMLLGLCGMAYFSSPPSALQVTAATSLSSTTTSTSTASAIIPINDDNNTSNGGGAYCQPLRPEDPDFLRPDEDEENHDLERPLSQNTMEPILPSTPFETDYVAMDETDTIDGNDTNGDWQDDDEDQNLLLRSAQSMGTNESTLRHGDAAATTTTTVLCCCGRMRVSERTLGILAAMIFTGMWGGSILVPMHYAPSVNNGLGYLFSFAVGASLVNLSLWMVRYSYCCCWYSSLRKAYSALPSFHFRTMWLYGGICGLLWSIGNFCSILAVQYLGQGVGYSATQASMLVSGLWGINYFHEIKGTETILKWYGSAMVTVVGILLLSYEHHQK
ncbi:drug/metabolite transporter superfamily protein [Nitzschia inconspicua]|uniref:Drug/metabolite transporter superfamily protein n=1 Tax=Nitzschia inconspicua TaxID=303405 RepID=A0A9K3PWI8_9STRA|nr:drug/metabolite transporter superfamily protein [Nitzschia inconspicua]KAG7362412.1 drug/metabolite transporter superfamily protein [Nitzschia inconspicua]